MKKIKIFSIFLLLLTLSSCSSKMTDTESFIKAPDLNSISLEGSWKVTQKKSLSNSTGEEVNKIENVYIDKDLIEIGSKYNLSPMFESQYVNTNSYFSSKTLSVNVEDITKEENIEIILITGLPRFSLEIVKISENKIYFESDGFQYFLERTSDTIPKDILSKYEKEKENGEEQEAQEEKIGVSIVVKYQTKEEGTNIIKTDYDSYYVYYDNTDYQNISKMYFNENIYLPSTTQNVLLKYEEVWEDSKYIGELKKLDPNNKSNNDLSTTLFESSNPFEINFISDEYYSISYNDQSMTSRKIYNIFKIEDEDSKSLNIEDIDPKNGKKIILNAINKEKENGVYNTAKNPKIDDYTNIGILKVDGLWKFRTSFVLGEKGETIKDVNFDLIPQKEIFNSNSLGKFKWSDIKSLFLNDSIADAFTSPESKFTLVNDGNNILFYSSTNLLNPIMTLPKKEGTVSIVMANWMVGNDTDLYRDEFDKDKIY